MIGRLDRVRVRATLWRSAIGAALLALMAGCVPSGPLYVPFQPVAGYGYDDRQTANDRFEVSYIAPSGFSLAYTKAERDSEAQRRLSLAFDMTLWRASELALQKGFAGFAIVDRSNDVQVVVNNDFQFLPFYPSFCDALHATRAGCFAPTFQFNPTTRYARIDAKVTLTLDFEHQTKPGAMDAKGTLDRLRTTYPMALQPGQPLG